MATTAVQVVAFVLLALVSRLRGRPRHLSLEVACAAGLAEAQATISDCELLFVDIKGFEPWSASSKDLVDMIEQSFF